MDPWAPINGITLERYAELSAVVTGENDPEKQAALVQAQGVQRPDWEAAKSGWTARMQDMSLMGAVATRYMPLYNAALARKSGGGAGGQPPQTTFEDYVGMSGCVPVMGHAGMLADYKLTEAQWTQIAMHWNQTIPTNPQYMQYGALVEQEAARIRNGGQPRALGAGGAAAAPAAAAPPQPYAQQPYYPQQPNYNAQVAQFGNQVGSAFNAFGSALGSFVDSAVGFAAGSRVTVQWSDGNRYPGTVAQAPRNGQIEVAFPDGRRVWIPQQYVSSV